jgi:hypothetical protein
MSRNGQETFVFTGEIKSALEVHPTSSLTDTFGSFPTAKLAERESDYLPSSSLEVKNELSCFRIKYSGGFL